MPGRAGFLGIGGLAADGAVTHRRMNLTSQVNNSNSRENLSLGATGRMASSSMWVEKLVRVVHVPFTFAPDPVGGTEIYVEALAHGLRAHGIESVIVAPSCSGIDEAYEHNALRVRRYRTAPESKYMLQELYGRGDPESAA